jgi:hypothetical protein
MTEIEPYIERGRIVLKEHGSLKDLTTALVEPYHADVARTTEVPFPSVPKPVELTEEVKDALVRLKDVFASVQPDTRRTLTDEEKTAVFEERQVLGVIADMISQRDESLKTIIRTHMDVDAEERGVAVPKAVVRGGHVVVEATDRTSEGHYILCSKGNPERCPVPGTNKEWSREYRNGTISVDASPEALLDLLDEGAITREEYLAMTREVRVFDEAKALSNAANKPEVRDGILRAIKRMTRVGKPSVGLYTRNSKK